jgi:hypothetical protein
LVARRLLLQAGVRLGLLNKGSRLGTFQIDGFRFSQHMELKLI